MQLRQPDHILFPSALIDDACYPNRKISWEAVSLYMTLAWYCDQGWPTNDQVREHGMCSRMKDAKINKAYKELEEAGWLRDRPIGDPETYVVTATEEGVIYGR